MFVHDFTALVAQIDKSYPHDDLTHEVIRLRKPTAENILDDLRLLKEGVLDPESFLNGYRFLAHPFELIHRDAEGVVKNIRRGHNMRTNKGGQLEGQQIAGTAATANAQWLAISSTATTSSILPTDTALGGEITAAGAAGLSIAGGTTGGPRVQIGTGTGSTTAGQMGVAVGTSTTANTTNQYKDTLQATFQWNNATPQTVTAVGVYDAATAGNLWFEFAFASLQMNQNDTLQVNYVINY